MSEVELDPMEGEQTWPTDDDLAEADRLMPPPPQPPIPTEARRVPKGTSDYQAAWIVDDSDSEEVSLLPHTRAYLLVILCTIYVLPLSVQLASSLLYWVVGAYSALLLLLLYMYIHKALYAHVYAGVGVLAYYCSNKGKKLILHLCL